MLDGLLSYSMDEKGITILWLPLYSSEIEWFLERQHLIKWISSFPPGREADKVRYNILISINIDTNNPMFIKNPITAVLSNYANPTILLSRPRKMLELNIWNPQDIIDIFHLELRTWSLYSVTRLLRCWAMSFHVFWCSSRQLLSWLVETVHYGVHGRNGIYHVVKCFIPEEIGKLVLSANTVNGLY